MNKPYGLTSLMEAIEASTREDDTIRNINEGVFESASLMDLGQDFIGTDDTVRTELELADDATSDEDDEQLDAIIDMIPDDEEDEELLEESFNQILESVQI